MWPPYFRQLNLILLLMALCTHTVCSHSLVEYLPGFPGKLPFKLETGYIGVGESEETQLFYYFIESERSPENDPLLIWLQGGPGCSGFSGLVYEIGPLMFDYAQIDSIIPALLLNPHSWTKLSNIIFIDQPVGTGFSYSKSPGAYHSNDTFSASLTYEFIKKWLINHPKFQKNPFYVAGESFCGIIVPLVVDLVYNGIKAGSQPHLNMKGYILGNPVTDYLRDSNEKVPYAHRMGLLSDELYKSVKENCNGSYMSVEPNNYLCKNDMEIVNRAIYYLYSNKWANVKIVQEALHVREGTIIEWVRCNRTLRDEAYTNNVDSTLNYHKKFAKQSDCRALIYSGDHDMTVSHLATEEWIRSLKLQIKIDWSPWFVEGQIAGYTTAYFNNDSELTYATVKGAGHTAPEFKPKECLSMIDRWLSRIPL